MNNVSDTKYTSIDEVIKKSTITDHQGNQVDVVNRIRSQHGKVYVVKQLVDINTGRVRSQSAKLVYDIEDESWVD